MPIDFIWMLPLPCWNIKLTRVINRPRRRRRRHLLHVKFPTAINAVKRENNRHHEYGMITIGIGCRRKYRQMNIILIIIDHHYLIEQNLSTR
jgi:hypothetical protein